MAMLWKQVKIYKWACGWVLNVDLNFVLYRYINFFCDTVYIKDYQIWLRVSNFLKLQALLATTSEQLVSITENAMNITNIELKTLIMLITVWVYR